MSERRKEENLQIKAPISCQVRDYVEAFLSFEDNYHGAD